MDRARDIRTDMHKVIESDSYLKFPKLQQRVFELQNLFKRSQLLVDYLMDKEIRAQRNFLRLQCNYPRCCVERDLQIQQQKDFAELRVKLEGETDKRYREQLKLSESVLEDFKEKELQIRDDLAKKYENEIETLKVKISELENSSLYTDSMEFVKETILKDKSKVILGKAISTIKRHLSNKSNPKVIEAKISSTIPT